MLKEDEEERLNVQVSGDLEKVGAVAAEEMQVVDDLVRCIQGVLDPREHVLAFSKILEVLSDEFLTAQGTWLEQQIFN